MDSARTADMSPHGTMSIDESASEPLSLQAVSDIVSRHRVLIALSILVCVILAVVLTLVTPRTYSSSSAIMPQSNRVSSGLSGLAAQLGVNVPSTEGGQSPAFYVELLTSRPILEATVSTAYSYVQDGRRRSGTLMDVYEIEAKTPELRRDLAVTRLARNVAVAQSQKSGVVRLTTKAPTPALAQSVNARMLELLNSFNLNTRKSRASAERQFTERRLAEVQADLLDAENRLMSFYQSNRNYENSPQLTFVHERLSREAARQQQLYTSISQAYEQAKLEEVRDTPVLTTVEAPSLPARPDPRGLVRRSIIAALIGLVIGLFLAFAVAMRDSRRYRIRTPQVERL